MCASPWSQPFTVPGPLSGQPCSCAPSLASCSGQASFSPLWSGEGCPSLPLTLARKEPVAEEGAALLLLQHEDCSTADQALLAASEAPAMHWTRDGKKSWLQLVLDLQDRGTPYQPCLQGSPPHREYLHTAAHHALGTMLTPRLLQTGPIQAASSRGVENGGHEAPVHQPPMQPHMQWVLPSQGCLLGTVSPKGCWC